MAAASIIFWLLLSLLDQARLQPWALMYAGVMLAVAFSKSRSELANAVLVVISFTYIWSGIQKMNPHFWFEVFPWFFEPWASWFHLNVPMHLMYGGIVVALFEIAIGVGLWLKTTRRFALIGALTMMVAVLGALGPFGHGWNKVVWPWNVAIATLAVLSVMGASEGIRRILQNIFSNWHGRVLLVTFGIMPLLSFVNLWDDYLSFSLYSGTPALASLLLSESDAASISPGVAVDEVPDTTKRVILPFHNWYLFTLGSAAYPEPRVYYAVGKVVCSEQEFPFTLVIQEKSLIGPGAVTSYICKGGTLQKEADVQ